MKQLLIVVASVLAGILLFAGLASAQAPETVKVTITEWKVELSTDTVPAGIPVKFTITNTGNVTHEVVLERAGAVDEPIAFAGHEQEAEDIAPGATARSSGRSPRQASTSWPATSLGTSRPA